MEGTAPFFAAIDANPEQDTPYLVFSDWLEEQGHPMADVVRLFVEMRKYIRSYKGMRIRDKPEVLKPLLREIRETLSERR